MTVPDLAISTTYYYRIDIAPGAWTTYSRTGTLDDVQTLACSPEYISGDFYQRVNTGFIGGDALAFDSGKLYLVGSDGVSTSTDGGQTWSFKFEDGFGMASTICYDVVAEGGIVWVATAKGFSKSVNNGASWTNPLTVSGPEKSVDFDGTVVAAATTSIADGTSSINFSTNAGDAWTTHAWDTAASGYITNLEVTGSTIYVSTTDGLYRTTTSDTSVFTKLHDYLGDTHDILVDGSDIWLATNAGILHSANAGSTWISLDTSDGLSHNQVYALSLWATGIVAATEEGLDYAADNATFVSLFSARIYNYLGYSYGKQVSDLVTGSGTLYANGNDLMYSSQDLSTWKEHRPYASSSISDAGIGSIAVSGGTIVTTAGGGLDISTDGGQTWFNRNVITSYDDKGVVIDGDRIAVCGGEEGIIISEDKGASWMLQKAAGNSYSALAMSGNLILASNGTTTGTTYVSTDGGDTWQTVCGGFGTPTIDGTRSYVAGINGLYVSSDSGLTWSNPKTTRTWGLSVDGTGLYGIDETGLIMSVDYGATWSTFLAWENAPFEWAHSLIVNGNNVWVRNGDQLYRSSDGGASWSIYGVPVGESVVFNAGKLYFATVPPAPAGLRVVTIAD